MDSDLSQEAEEECRLKYGQERTLLAQVYEVNTRSIEMTTTKAAAATTTTTTATKTKTTKTTTTTTTKTTTTRRKKKRLDSASDQSTFERCGVRQCKEGDGEENA
jgi:hypothetical protein